MVKPSNHGKNTHKEAKYYVNQMTHLFPFFHPFGCRSLLPSWREYLTLFLRSAVFRKASFIASDLWCFLSSLPWGKSVCRPIWSQTLCCSHCFHVEDIKFNDQILLPGQIKGTSCYKRARFPQYEWEREGNRPPVMSTTLSFLPWSL